MFLDSYIGNSKVIADTAVLHTLNGIRNRICFANDIDTGEIHLHVAEKEQVNAVTLPLGHIVIHTGLIKECDNAEMMAGVMAHEIAHDRLNHIGKRMATEIGLSVGLNILFGDSGFIMNMVHMLTSNGFSRKQEQDADDAGMRYLQNASIDTRPMGVFLKKLANAEQNIPEWTSTHPEPGKRAKAILMQNKGRNYVPLLPDTTWRAMQKVVITAQTRGAW